MHRFFSPTDSVEEISRDRRLFIRNISVGAAVFTLGASDVFGLSQEFVTYPDRSSVSFIKGDDRREMVYQAMKPFEKEIKEGIRGKKILIKVNLIDPNIEIATTNVDAVRGALDFLTPLCKDTITVGDSTGRPGGTMECLKNHHYFDLEKEYNVKLVDLNYDTTTVKWIITQDFHPLDIEIIDSFLDPDNYIISLTRPKTHGNAVATLSVKNIMMGSPVNVITRKNRLSLGQKTKMHFAGNKGLNYNIFYLAQEIKPKLCIVDGLVGMEGNGPSYDGTKIDHGFCIAGTDMLAVDRIGVELMGIDFNDIGYLNYIAWAGQGQSDLGKIDILGEDYRPHILKYKLHDNYANILDWKEGLVIDKM